MVEQILKDYASAYGLRSIALRYFNAAGCSEDGSVGERHEPETHLLPLVLFEALRVKAGGKRADTTLKVFGDDFATRDGTCIRDYIHVNDLCSAHIAAFERMNRTEELGAEQFNLGVNQGYSVLEVIETCREVTGIDFTYDLVARRAGDPPELVADASLAMQALDWTPQYAHVKDSIRHAWRWFLEHPPSTIGR
jgi:UDP-glucose 4-epimerase